MQTKRLMIALLATLALSVGLISCTTPQKQKKEETGVPAKGKWSASFLAPSAEKRFRFISEQLSEHQWTLGDTFKVKTNPDFKIQYDEYLDIFHLPDKIQGSFDQTLKAFNPQEIQNYVPKSLNDDHLDDVEILWQNLLIIEEMVQHMWARYKLNDPAEPWERFGQSLDVSRSILGKMCEDGYVKWVAKHLFQALKVIESKNAPQGLPKKSEQIKAWLNLNYSQLLAGNQVEAKRVFLTMRNRKWAEKATPLAEKMAQISKTRTSRQREIRLEKKDRQIRTLFTGQSRLFDTSWGRRYRGISWIATDAKGTAYFSDYENIYRLEKGNPPKEVMIIQGAKDFFHPTVFYIDKYYNLYLLEGTHFRQIDLRSKKVKNYPLGPIFPQFQRETFYGIYPFTMDPAGNLYLVHQSQQKIYKVRPNPSNQRLQRLNEYRFKGKISSLLYHNNKLYLANYETHVIQVVDPNLEEVKVYAGAPSVGGHRDGSRSNSLFNHPFGLAAAPNGDIIVADEGNHCLRRIAAGNHVSTVAGTIRGEKDGPVSQGRLSLPISVSATSDGVYFAEQKTATVRVVADKNWTYPRNQDLTFNNIFDHLDKAKDHMKNSRYRDAAKVLDEAIKVGPVGRSLFQAKMYRGQVSIKVKFYSQATTYFTQCIEMNPRFANTYLYRGDSYLLSGETQNALVDYNKVIDLKKNLPSRRKFTDEAYVRAWISKARAQAKLGRIGEAVSSCTRFLRLIRTARTTFNLKTIPWENRILKMRSQLYEQQGNLPKAIADLGEILTNQPKSIPLLWKQAQLYFQNAQYPESVVKCKEILNLKSGHEKSHEMLADIYFQHIANDQKSLLHYQYYVELGGKNKKRAKERITKIIQQRKDRGKVYTDIFLEQGGVKYRIRYFSDGKVEKQPVN